MRLKLQYDETLSNFTFNFKLRRYAKGFKKQVSDKCVLYTGDQSDGHFLRKMKADLGRAVQFETSRTPSWKRVGFVNGGGPLCIITSSL